MHLLDLNLSHRPFRNNTLLWAGYGTATLALALFSAWSVMRYDSHRRLLDRTGSEILSYDTRMDQLQERNQRVLQAVRNYDLRQLGFQASKANEVITWKAFSWTRLFNALEEIQPWDVRLTSLRPIFRGAAVQGAGGSLELASVPVAVEGIAKTFRDVMDLQRDLQGHARFGRVEPVSFKRTERGEIKFQLRFQYLPALPEEEVAGEEAPADEGREAPPDGGAAEAVEDPAGAGEAVEAVEVEPPPFDEEASDMSDAPVIRRPRR